MSKEYSVDTEQLDYLKLAEHYIAMELVTREENRRELQKLITRVLEDQMAESGVATATPETALDAESFLYTTFQMYNPQLLQLMEEDPELARISAQARDRIENPTLGEQVYDMLEKADINLRDESGDINPHVIPQVQAAYALESHFGIASSPSFADRLAQAKDALVAAAKSDGPKHLTSLAMFGVSAAAGTLPVYLSVKAAKAAAGHPFATDMRNRVMASPTFQTISERVTTGIRDTFVALGGNPQAVEKARDASISTLSGFARNHPRATAAIAASGIAAGFGLMAIMSNDWSGYDAAVAKIKDTMSSAMAATADMGGTIGSAVAEQSDKIVSVTTDAFQSAADYTGGVADHYLNQPVSTDLTTAPDPTGPTLVASPGISDLAPASARMDVAPDVVEAAPAGPLTTEYEVKSGDTAWDIAEAHYIAANGTEPTVVQIAEMVNSLGLEDPNSISVGQVVSFPNEVPEYDRVTNTDWLQSPESAHLHSPTATTSAPKSLAWNEAEWGPEPPRVNLAEFEKSLEVANASGAATLDQEEPGVTKSRSPAPG